MAEVADWDPVDGNNDSAPPVGWPEGMLPSQVNDAARAMQGALRREHDRVVNGTLSLPYLPLAGGTLTGAVTATSVTASGTLQAALLASTANITASGSVTAALLASTANITAVGTVAAADVTVSGTVSAPIVAATGAGAFLEFEDRTGGASWGWYSTANVARLYNGADRVTIDASGTIFAGAGVQAASNGVGAFYAPNGGITVGTVVHALGEITGESGLLINGSGSGAVYAPNGGITAGGDLTAGGNVVAGVDGLKPGGGVWSALSDSRLKKDAVPYTTGLSAITALVPVTYKYNGMGGVKTGERQFVGLVADDVVAVMPEMVSTMKGRVDPRSPVDSDDIKILNTTALPFAIINAIKELTARIAVLEAAIKV